MPGSDICRASISAIAANRCAPSVQAFMAACLAWMLPLAAAAWTWFTAWMNGSALGMLPLPLLPAATVVVLPGIPFPVCCDGGAAGGGWGGLSLPRSGPGTHERRPGEAAVAVAVAA